MPGPVPARRPYFIRVTIKNDFTAAASLISLIVFSAFIIVEELLFKDLFFLNWLYLPLLKNIYIIIIIYGRIKFANVHATKAYKEVELYLLSFLISVLEVWKSIMLRDRGFRKLLWFIMWPKQITNLWNSRTRYSAQERQNHHWLSHWLTQSALICISNINFKVTFFSTSQWRDVDWAQ
jgi:hypothetical protein